MSAFMNWSCEDVSKWIESLGYQQYTACFTENYINGRKLILVNCATLPRLGVTDFKDMKVKAGQNCIQRSDNVFVHLECHFLTPGGIASAISGHIRELLEILDPRGSRSIALPPVKPRRLFLEEKSRTGSTADSLTYIPFFKERGLDEYT